MRRSALAIGPVDQASPLLGRDQAGGGARLARVRVTKLVNASSAADLAIGLLSKPTPLLGRDQAGGGAFNIDPPTSSYAIMRRARPYRGENSGPGKDDSQTRN
jgi:hypothetical protein